MTIDSQFQRSQACPHCGATAGVDQREKPPHLGLWCRACDRWLTWLPQGRPVHVMPFGAHKGVAIKGLPDDYLTWLLENVELRGSLFRSLSEEFERRGRIAA